MPFDIAHSKTMTMLERYRELLRLIDESRHGPQTNFTTCLWSEVRRHQPFIDAGLDPTEEDRGGISRVPNKRVYDFFLGAEALPLTKLKESSKESWRTTLWLFGTASIDQKRSAVVKKIAELESMEL